MSRDLEQSFDRILNDSIKQEVDGLREQVRKLTKLKDHVSTFVVNAKVHPDGYFIVTPSDMLMVCDALNIANGKPIERVKQ